MKNLKMKFARIEQDISQIELANRIGVTRQTIGMIEAGDYNPSLKLCIAIHIYNACSNLLLYTLYFDLLVELK